MSAHSTIAAPPCDGGRDPSSGIRRVGYVYAVRDPLSPKEWSGTPRSLALGLRSLGLEVVPVAYRVPPVLRQTVALMSNLHGRGQVAHAAPVKSSFATRVLAREVRRGQPLDALIAIGTDRYNLQHVAPPAMPVATYDDGTFAQFMRHPDSDPRRNAFPERDVRRWCARQAAAARRATACCVPTEWAASSMVDDYGVARDRVHIVGMGHRPRHPDRGARDWSTPRFLFVGVDWGRKNGDLVVRAFARFHDLCPEAVLDVVGDHPPLRGPGVVGHGFLPREDKSAQEALDDLYARATVFVLPSRFDPSPVASLEAASAGLPVIGTTEGGAGELLGNAAICVHPDDEDGLLEAMRRLAEPGTARLLGREAARRAQQSTWEAVARRIVESLTCHTAGLGSGGAAA
jgi:glycosyltransferase involved in cell wall biosynthesis